MSLARQITEERLRELLDENKTEIVEAVAALLADAAPKRRRRPVEIQRQSGIALRVILPAPAKWLPRRSHKKYTPRCDFLIDTANRVARLVFRKGHTK